MPQVFGVTKHKHSFSFTSQNLKSKCWIQTVDVVHFYERFAYINFYDSGIHFILDQVVKKLTKLVKHDWFILMHSLFLYLNIL